MKIRHVITPDQLLEALTKLFPTYTYEQEKKVLGEFTYHELLQDFVCFFGENNSRLTDRQVKNFARLVNYAVEAGGVLENAFATCFLEHLGQVGARKPLLSYLSRASKKRLHA